MRKFLATGILFFALFSASAQNAPKGKKLDWGIKTGINVSRLNIDNTPSDLKWRSGFNFGTFFRIKAGSNFQIQLEPGYASMGGAEDNGISGERAFRLNYFTFPVLANYHINKNWRAIIGPEFDFLITAKQVVEGSATKVDGDYDDHSIGATAGFEYWPSSAVGFQARYIHGFTNIQPASTMKVKNQSIQVTVAVKL